MSTCYKSIKISENHQCLGKLIRWFVITLEKLRVLLGPRKPYLKQLKRFNQVDYLGMKLPKHTIYPVKQ
ncbi:unnamed protein product [Plutella xylostella]|uniref:(diamondback moth) hypothetical protein n=1 Tax=Plutella xylostella TaxID=51655 RepID=A0A8S4GBP8_PLUXY|nr:unnamed protein product [Plutella xylostella]